MLNLNIVSLNLNSLNLSEKSCQLFTKTNLKLSTVLDTSADIILLQDIRAGNQYNYIRHYIQVNAEGAYRAFLNSPLTSRGVAIFIRDDLDLLIDQTLTDELGNYLILNGRLEGKNICIGSIYGPNGTEPNFFTDLGHLLHDFSADNLIIGGDFNCVWDLNRDPNTNIDLKGANGIPNVRNSMALHKIARDLNLTDALRSKCPLSKSYSFFSKMNLSYASRLDMILLSSNLTQNIDKIEYPPPSINLFDHSMVRLSLKGSKPKNSHSPTIDNLNLDFLGIREHSDIINLRTLSQYLSARDRNFEQQIDAIDEMLQNALKAQAFWISNEKSNMLLKEHISYTYFNISLLIANLDFKNLINSREFIINKTRLLQVITNNFIINIANIQKYLKLHENAIDTELFKSHRRAIRTGQFLEASEIRNKIDSRKLAKIKKQISNNRLFAILSNERASAAFCKLGKIRSRIKYNKKP